MSFQFIQIGPADPPRLHCAGQAACFKRQVHSVLSILLLPALLVSCSSSEDISQTNECEVDSTHLAGGIAQARKLVEDADETILGEYRFSTDQGGACGFWFEIHLRPEYSGDLLAGPIEVILSKDDWKYVDTKYYSHELLVE